MFGMWRVQSFFLIGLVIGIARVQGLRGSGTNISTDLPATVLVVNGIQMVAQSALFGDDACVWRACD
jgi:hypothetical protein